MAEAAARRLVPTVYTPGGVEAFSRVVGDGGLPPLEVHLKVDTGMHRVGADADEALDLAEAIATDPHLRLGALWTHLAVADGADPGDREFTLAQVDRFDALVAALADSGHRPPMVHVAELGRHHRGTDGPPRPGSVRDRGLRRGAYPGPVRGAVGSHRR